jgi:hypothetical protein
VVVQYLRRPMKMLKKCCMWCIQNIHLSLSGMTVELNLDKETVSRILSDGLGIKKF